MLLAACGGIGNVPPQLIDPGAQVLVASRAIVPLRLRAVDPDSTMVYFSARFSTSTSNASFEGVVPGMTLNRLTGEISGAPAFPDRYKVTVTATDSEGATDVRTIDVEVLSESLAAEVRTRDEDGRRLTELVLTAADTARAGTVAYCIRADARQPSGDDPCFDRKGDQLRSLVVPIVPGVPVAQHYLFTKNAKGSVLAAEAAPSAPFSRDLWEVAMGSDKPVVGVQTSAGAFVVEIDPIKSPNSAANFLQYVDDRFFDGTVFHRIVSNFVIQGGGFVYGPTYTAKGQEDGLRPPIALERTSLSGLSNKRGTLAMARGELPDTATSQFFINLVDNSASLDAGGLLGADGYAVFGKVLPDASSSVSPLPAAIAAIRETITTDEGGLGVPGEASLPVGAPPLVRYMLRMR